MTAVLVLMGGPDAERAVSISSGTRVAGALARAGGFAVHAHTVGRLDAAALASLPGEVIFPVLHGPWGEGGPLQELLEADGRPFVGCESQAARLAMDKARTKAVARELGIRTPDWQLLPGEARRVHAPAVVKPIDDGSSVDMRICRDDAALDEAITALAPRRGRLLVEQFVRGREITVGVLGSRALPVIEIVPAVEFYDYEAKYTRDDTQYLLEPALPEGVREEAVSATLRIFRGIGCRDIARADFLVDERGAWFLEINTMPGMTDHSLVPKAAAHCGIPFEQMCASLVHAACARERTTCQA